LIRAVLRRWGAAVERGQSLVGMGFILPLLVLIVLGTLEFGFVFDHHLTLEYATREGARAGAALANGEDVECDLDNNGTFDTPTWSCVDPLIIAAVQRVLTSPGSPVDVGNVSEIRIYRSDEDGNEEAVNVWRPSAGMGPHVGGARLNFIQHSVAWAANTPLNGANNAQSVGISVIYTYELATPFGFILGDGLSMTDRTIMQLNPTN
jgi:Flp pilus assembly protein TadG